MLRHYRIGRIHPEFDRRLIRAKSLSTDYSEPDGLLCLAGFPSNKIIMNKTYKEIFEQERDLSTALAKHWGYNLKNIALDSRSKRESEGKTPIVANINTLRLTRDIPKTDRIVQIEEELRAIENGRLLAKFTEEAARKQLRQGRPHEEKSPIILLMEEKVKEYNHIITHKHLNKDYHEETRRILKIDKDDAEELLEKIQQSENKLKEGNLSTQIHINKYMAQLYKSYRAKIENSRSITQKHQQKTKTMVSQPAKSGHNITKHEEIPKIQRARHFSKHNSERKTANSRSDRALLINMQTVHDKLRQTGGRVNSHDNNLYSSLYPGEANHGNVTDRTSNRRAGSRQSQERITKTIYSPFLEREKLQQYRNIEKTNNSNFITLDMFKNKISEYKIKSIPHKAVKTKKATTYQHSLEGKSSVIKIDTNGTNGSVAMNEEEKSIYNSIIAQNKEKYYEQKIILAELLKKKHNKYNKVGLSRVLVKYDELKEAKQLLKGDFLDKNRSTSTRVPSNPLHGSKTSPKYNNMTSKLIDGLAAVYDDADENQHYQRMCKNQKINLLLKHK